MVRAVVQGTLENAIRCDAGCRLPVQPTVVWLDADMPVITISPRFADFSAAMGDAGLRRLFLDLWDEHHRMIHLAGAEEMRSYIDADLQLTTSVLERFCVRPFEDISQQWRAVKASEFAAAVVVAEQMAPHQREILLGNLADGLALVWISLCLEWTDKDNLPSGSLESDLARYVDPMPLVPQAFEKFRELNEVAQQGAEDSEYESYVLAAVLGAVRVSQGGTSEGREPQRWANHYVMHEYYSARHRRYRFFAWRREVRNQRDRRLATRLPLARILTMTSRSALVEVIQTYADVAADPDVGGDVDKATLIEFLDDITDAAVAAGAQIIAISALPHQGTSASKKDMLAALREVRRRGADDLDAGKAEALATHLAESGRADVLIEAVDEFLQEKKIGGRKRWLWEAFLCEKLVLADRFQTIVDRIGPETESAESRLPLRVQVGLARSRAISLRGMHRRSEALEALRHLDPPAEGPIDADYWDVLLTRSRLLRALGYPEAALEILSDLSSRAPQCGYPLYETIGATNVHLGRLSVAIEAYERAVADAAGRNPAVLGTLQGQWLRARVIAGHPVDFDLLRTLSLAGEGNDVSGQLHAAYVWCSLIELGEVTPPLPAEPAELFARLPVLAAESVEEGDYNSHRLALYLWAWSAETSEPSAALARFRDYRSAMAEDGILANEEALIRLARLEILYGDPPEAQRILCEGVEVSHRRFEEMLSYNAVVGIGTELARPYEALLGAARKASPLEQPAGLLRLCAELRRDSVRRSAWGRSTAVDALRGGLTDEQVHAAAERGDILVLERLHDRVLGSVVVCTAITASGVRTATADSVPGDIDRLGPRLAYRLSTWTPRRPGDPFAVNDWADFCRWLGRFLGAFGEASAAHVVVIDDLRHNGAIPWHVALAGLGRTCSYSTGWLDLLSASRAETRAPATVSIAAVPRLGDNDEITHAFDEGVEAIAAHANGARIAISSGINCTAASFRTALAESELGIWLLHGYVSPETQTTGVMLAASGRLPLASSVASASPIGREHRQPCTEIEASGAPRVIVSAACSSATTYSAGLGERLGWYSALQRHGLQTFVGPQWDVQADSTVPMIASVARALINRSAGPATAVKQVADTAVASGIPTWIARSLTVEGAWQ
jgi:tetratricopeptide (TPR) repeat protein